MAYPALLTDTNSNIIPQYYDGSAWQPFEGERQGPYLSGSASPTATSVTISLGAIGTNTIYDAKSATVAVANGSTAQTITNVVLQFTDTIGGQAVNINYPVMGVGSYSWGPSNQGSGATIGTPVSIAQSSNQSFSVPLNSGILKNVNVIVYFASAPTTGTVNVQVALSNQPANGFSIGPRLLLTVPYTMLTASVNTKFDISGALNKAAKARTFTVFNGSNNATGTSNIWLYDSQIISSVAYSSQELSLAAINANNYFTFTDSPIAQATANASASSSTNEAKSVGHLTDSVILQVIYGTTAATSGNLYLYVTEMF